MSGSAHITSTDAVREFRVALQEFESDLRDAIDSVLLELQRAKDWVEQDRARYWPNEARRASDGVVEARSELERCEMAIRAEDRRSCYEQRKALEQAKLRLRLTEQKVRAVRRWRVTVHQEGDALHGRLLKLTDFVDTEIPRALTSLQRMIAALEKYTERVAPTDTSSNSDSSATSDAGDAS